VGFLTVKRKGYTSKDGTRVKASTYKIEDKGEPGRTPKEEQWFEPGVETGWEKGQPESVRRAKVLKAHKGDELASARSMQALSNVTTDRETANKAARDAKFFYRQYRGRERARAKLRRGKTLRVTPKRPKLR